MENKSCNKCYHLKPTNGFYSLDNTCKECRKLLIRKYRDDNAEKIKAYDRIRGKLPHRIEKTIANTRNRRKDPDGYLIAHSKVAYALRKGRLERQPCCMCGITNLVHAHHDDYSKPLEVMWLCVSHHKARHAYLDYINNEIF